MYSVTELMRKLSQPIQADESRLKRVVHYIRTLPRYMARFPWHEPSDTIEVFTDSDHAGCPKTRRSTLGGCILWGGLFHKRVVENDEHLSFKLRGIGIGSPSES